MPKQDYLLVSIEKKRNELVLAAAKCGLNSPTAVKISQELDKLLNEYYLNTNKKIEIH